MHVTLLGATGKVGAPVLDELVRRGHRVVAVCRDAGRLPTHGEDVDVCAGDVFDPEVLAGAVRDADVVVCSVALRDTPQRDRTPDELLRVVSRAAATAGARLVTMGGAGSLRGPDGVDLVDRPEFPDLARPESLGFRQALRDLRGDAPAGLVWSMLSPPMSIEVDADRTGVYRTADDTPVVDESGASRISAADLAVALVDEVERAEHSGARFTVAY